MAAQRSSTKRSEPRQQPGLACEGCRNRKMRCDRKEPTCNNCAEQGIVCVPNLVKQPRGPKKGHLRSLQSRILSLERQLGEYNCDAQIAQTPGISSDRDAIQQPSPSSVSPDLELFLHSPPVQFNGSTSLSGSDQAFVPRLSNSSPSQLMIFPAASTATTATTNVETWMDMDFFAVSAPLEPKSTIESATTCSSADMLPPEAGKLEPLTNLQRTDLNHLYFDRVHAFLPFLHRRSYFRREAAQDTQTKPFATLQHAMWTMAASMGSQFQHAKGTLYTATRSMLQTWEQEMLGEAISIEYVQAWLLLALYEIIHVSYERAYITVGRCSRLVHLLKLHQVDDPKASADGHCSWLEKEGQRRTFWATYFLDRMLSLLSRSPSTVSEQMIMTHLPASERAYQQNRPSQSGFLVQIIMDNQENGVSGFGEVIFWVTIAERCLALQQESALETSHGATRTEDLGLRHKRLSGVLHQKLEARSTFSIDEDVSEAVQLFTDMTAWTASLLLSQAAPQHENVTMQDFNGGRTRSLTTFVTISALIERLSELSSFMIHPFTPALLYHYAECLGKPQVSNTHHQLQRQVTIEKLRQIASLNKLAQFCLASLDT